MVAILNVHYSRSGDLEIPDHLITSPSVSLESYRDGFGNWCTRLVATPGEFTLSKSGVVRDSGEPEAVAFNAAQHAIEDLPSETFICRWAKRG